MAKGLWDDIDGERWLDNPQLIIANPRKKRRAKTMARRKARRRGRKNAPRRRHRRNYTAAGLINRPRRRRRVRRARRSYAMNRRRRGLKRNYRRRRSYRRNPSVLGLGFNFPPLDAVLFTGAGLIVPPIVASYITPMLPDSIRNSKLGYYGVKAASVLIPSMLIRKFVSRRAGNYLLIGGFASFAIDIVREFMPTLLPASSMSGQPFLGFYERMPQRLPAASGMGRYASVPVRSVPVQRTPLVSLTPERLSPSGRF